MKRLISFLVSICILIVMISSAFAAEPSFTINGVTVRPSSGTAVNNCAKYASQILGKIWNCRGVTTEFNTKFNMIKSKSAQERKITEAHVKDYIQAAPLGSRIRISHYSSETIDNRDNNLYGHTLVLVAKNNSAGTFTTLEAGGGKGEAKTYTYKNFTDYWAKFNQKGVIGYTYFFYIADLTSFGAGTNSNKPSDLKINISSGNYPTGTLKQGKFFSLKGTITSGYMITSVKGEIVRHDGVVVDSYSQTATTKNFSIYNSKIDRNLEFNFLPSGTYYVRYTATDASGKTATWDSKNREFTIDAVDKNYTVTFDPSGGYVSTSYKTVTVGETYGTLPVPSKNGYSFVGWYTNPSSGTNISATTKVSLSGNQTLYAHWDKEIQVEQFYVEFDSISGFIDPILVTNGQKYGTLPSPKMDGYVFEGWYTSLYGGTHITSSTTVNLRDHQTLYAHWSDNTITVTFDATGGYLSDTSKQFVVGGTYDNLPTPTKRGYDFYAWCTNANESGRYFYNTTQVAANDDGITLYAVWRRSEDIKVVYDTMGGYTYYNGAIYNTELDDLIYKELPVPEKAGYEFVGWYSSPEDGTKVVDGMTLLQMRDHSIYAHWREINNQPAPSNLSVTGLKAVMTYEGIFISFKAESNYTITGGSMDFYGPNNELLMGGPWSISKDTINWNEYHPFLANMVEGETYYFNLIVKDYMGGMYDQTVSFVAPFSTDNNRQPKF